MLLIVGLAFIVGGLVVISVVSLIEHDYKNGGITAALAVLNTILLGSHIWSWVQKGLPL